MADAPETIERRDRVGERLMTAYMISSSLAHALFYTGLGIAFFLLAFLGYFTVSFLFLAVAILLIASTTVRRKYQRVRGRNPRR